MENWRKPWNNWRKLWKNWRKPWKNWRKPGKNWRNQWKKWRTPWKTCRKQWKIEENHGKLKKTMEQLKKTMETLKKTMEKLKKTMEKLKRHEPQKKFQNCKKKIPKTILHPLSKSVPSVSNTKVRNQTKHSTPATRVSKSQRHHLLGKKSLFPQRQPKGTLPAQVFASSSTCHVLRQAVWLQLCLNAVTALGAPGSNCFYMLWDNVFLSNKSNQFPFQMSAWRYFNLHHDFTSVVSCRQVHGGQSEPSTILLPFWAASTMPWQRPQHCLPAKSLHFLAQDHRYPKDWTA